MTLEKFFETWTAPYSYGDGRAVVRQFLEDFKAAQAKADPYHGKSETLVLPPARGHDRGINRERK
jgi:hypothetical protein